MIQSVIIDGNILKVRLGAAGHTAGACSLCIQKRREGGTEGDLKCSFEQKPQENGKGFVLEAAIDLKGLQEKGYYWDLYLEQDGSKTKLAVPRDEIAGVRGRAVATEFLENSYASLRLYPNGNGELFLKRVYRDAVLESDKEPGMTLEEFLNSGKCEKKGSRYVKLTEEEGGLLLEFEETGDFAGGEAAVVLIPEKEEKKYIFQAAKQGGNYLVDLGELSKAGFDSKTSFGMYFAAAKDGRYYLLRLKERKEAADVEKSVSTLIREDIRYKSLIPLGVVNGRRMACLPYRGLYHELLSLMVDEEEKCRELKEESFRVFTEKMGEPYPFRFSIVMAVYNVEEFIMEAVESVFAQDIGFEKHIQLILSDDGSGDNSGKLCDEIAKRYPGNVVVIHKENGGAASARNEGKKYARGKYVNFMDPDDKISPDVCSKVWEFFEENQDGIDVAAFPIRFFGAQDSEYWQNYKFKEGTRVIDLYREWTVSDMNTAASFIKNRVVQEHEFDGRTPVGEDLKYLLYILMDKMKLGVVDGCWYYYRRRGGSLIASSRKKKSYYLDYMDYLVEEVQQYCLNHYGYIERYVQNTLMMDLQWKLLMQEMDPDILTGEELESYKAKLVKALQNIDDEVILEQKKIFSEHKYQVLRMKYGRKPEVQRIFKDIIYRYGSTIFNREADMTTPIEFINLNEEYLTIEGYSNMLEIQEGDQVETYVSVGGILSRCERGSQKVEKHNFMGKLCHCQPFVARIPITDEMLGKKIYLYTVINGHAVARRNLKFFKFTPFSGALDGQYYVKDQLVLRRDRSGFYVERCRTDRERMKWEEELCSELEELRRKKEREGDMQEASVIARALALRKNHFKKDFRRKKKIWLISDRVILAGDNGEAFFEYMNQIKPKDIEVYFVISEQSADYERMKKIGKVLIYKSEKHLQLHLKADKIISSQVDDIIFQPFDELYDYLRDLCNYKFVFLQHGITKDDVSSWLNRYNKNIAMFVTAAKEEYESILEGPYYYTKQVVKLTGFPRFDKLDLKRKPKKQILFMPTWRAALESGLDEKTGVRTYRPEFKTSYYYQFYQRLIQDERLLRVMKKYGYSGKFFLHPANIANISDFEGNEVIHVQYSSAEYRKEFEENALLITDYSSVAFDFAYFRKPVIYTQTDREEFFSDHLYDEGYWNYETMGFGPVCSSYDETVEAIISRIENDCILEDRYKKRIEDFYYYFDRKNCERVYNEIRKI